MYDCTSHRSDSPEPHEEDEGHQEGCERDAVAQVVYDHCNMVVHLTLVLKGKDTHTHTHTHTHTRGRKRNMSMHCARKVVL